MLKDALEQSHELLTSVLKATDVMLVYLDPDFNFVWVNDAYAETCGFLPEEMVGKNHFDLYPHAENEAIFRRVRDNGEPIFYKDKAFEFPDQPERGVTYWDWSLVPTKDRDGSVRGLVFSLRETTRFKQAELALEESEERFRLFTNYSPTCAWIKDEHGRYVYLNKAHETAFGIRVDDWLGKTDTECWPEDTASQFQLNDLAVLTGTQPVEVIEETVDKDGSRRYWLCNKFPFTNATGRRFIGGIALDVSELKRTQEELAVATEKAEEARQLAESANETKDRYLAMVSHELRGPLSPIANTVALLRTGAVPDNKLRERLDVIDRNVELQRHLVDDLMDISRIVSGKLRLRRQFTDVANAITEAGRFFRTDLEAKGQTLDIDMTGAPYCADADAERLGQVFRNLLSNAIKFTARGGHIGIRARIIEAQTPAASPETAVGQNAPQTGSDLLVEFIDDGCGIDPQVAPRLFMPFEQGESGRRHGGLGLGLAICKNLVELHNGTISVHSDGLGHGATFAVRLPLAS